MNNSQGAPIGVFDSGVGGLTVLKSLEHALPNENFIYFGDTARLPYGNKSASTIIRYAFEDALFLLRRGAKLLVVACNTASAVALDELQRYFRIPLVGMIEPCAREAAVLSSGQAVGVIGTAATIRSGSYQRAIESLLPGVRVHAVACPLFVPLVESGWQDEPPCFDIARRYLSPLVKENVDSLVLGCTHYPMLDNVISSVMGDGVALIDSAAAAAKAVVELLARDNIASDSTEKGQTSFFLSDFQDHFAEIAQRILGRRLENVAIAPSGS